MITLTKSAHAIGFFARSPQAFYVFDPNYGLYRYKDIDSLKSDIWGLFVETYDYKQYSRWYLRALQRLT